MSATWLNSRLSADVRCRVLKPKFPQNGTDGGLVYARSSSTVEAVENTDRKRRRYLRLALLIPMLGAALQADPVTVMETKSALGLTDLFYSFDVPTSPGVVTATIRGGANCRNAVLACGDQSATAAIDLTMNLYTPGPVRNGMAMLQLILTSSGTAGGAIQQSVAIGPYSLGCPKDLDCHLSGYFPFELGVPFTIDLSGLANAFPPLGDAGFLVSASLQMFEVPEQGGSPVQISLVPEPGAATLAVTGLLALLLFAALRKRKLSLI